MNRFPITNSGFEKLELELKNLKTVERPSVIKSIAEAREHGDLSENAEYHAAKEKQSFIEGRIADLENKISRAEVIKTEKLTGDKVIFGATVTLADIEKKKKLVYQIVGTEEADVENGKVSISSPLAKALLGKKIDDDTLETNLPNLLPEDTNTDVHLFLDFGNVWGVDYDSSLEDSNKIRSSTGVTASWQSPIGPLSFTLSQNLSKADTDVTQDFSFNLGTTF